METEFHFLPHYLQIASFFIHGDLYNEKKATFLEVCKCSRCRVAKSEFPKEMKVVTHKI